MIFMTPIIRSYDTYERIEASKKEACYERLKKTSSWTAVTNGPPETGKEVCTISSLSSRD